MKRAINNKSLERKLIPDYQLGCKRILASDCYLQCLSDPKIEIITDSGIQKFQEKGILDSSNRFHDLDLVIMATGFQTKGLINGS